MSKTLQLILLLSLLFMSRAAIDLSKWELFSEHTFKLSFSGQKLSKLDYSGAGMLGCPIRYLDQTTQTWVLIGDEIQATTHEFSLFMEFATSYVFPFLYWRVPGLTEWEVDSQKNAEEFDVNSDYLWFINSDKEVFRWNFANSQITNQGFPGDAKKIAIMPNTFEVFVIRENGDIFRGTGGGGAAWTNIPGKARNLAVTSSWELYIVSEDVADNGNYVIKKRVGTSWQEIEGIEGIFITFDSNDNLYVVTSDFKVYRQKGVVSQFCPRCGSPDFGYCTPTKNQCLNCPPRTTVVTSPLSCVACEANCNVCQFNSPSKCLACDDGYLLTSGGKCIIDASCVAPAIPDTTTKTCKAPCDDSISGEFYYPSEPICRPYCGLPIEDPTFFYQRCQVCTTPNCWECSSTVQTCTKCFSPLYLNVLPGIGTYCSPVCINGSPITKPDGSRACI